MTVAVAPTQRSPYAVFRSRAFSLLWAGQFISTAGSALSMLASSILVYRVTGSALSVGLMLIITMLPSVLVGLIAGVIVDRYDRKRVMMIADGVRAALLALTPVLVLGTAGFHMPGGIVWLYILTMLAGGATQFFEPAFSSVLPEVASEEDLIAANALMQISTFGSTAIGFAGAGLLAAAAPIEWAFYLDALSFLVSAACIGLATIPAVSSNATGGASVTVVWQNVRAGIRYLFASRVLRSLFFVSIPVALATGLSNALLLPFADRALHATSFEYGLQEGLTSVGFVIGSLALASLADRIQAGQLAAIGLVGMALLTAIYASLTSPWIAILIMLISGFFNAPMPVVRSLLIQRHTPREARGRVFSAFFVVRNTLGVVGLACVGLADLVSVRALYVSVAVVFVLSAALYAVAPGLRQSAAEWRRLTVQLRAVKAAAGLGAGRVPAPADIDLLAGLLPPTISLSQTERDLLLGNGRVYDVRPHTAVIRQGEISDSVYFILHGRVAVGQNGASSDNDTPLAILTEGDFFGEIAALTASPRTATVVTDDAATLLEAPVATLRQLMRDPALHRLFVSAMTSRLLARQMVDLPRLAALDQEALADLSVKPSSSDSRPSSRPTVAAQKRRRRR